MMVKIEKIKSEIEKIKSDILQQVGEENFSSVFEALMENDIDE